MVRLHPPPPDISDNPIFIMGSGPPRDQAAWYQWILDFSLWIFYYPFVKIRRVLESIFGSPAKVGILRVLFVSPQPLSGRQVGELSGLTHKGAIQALGSLVELGAVRQRRVGRAYQYSLSKGNIFVEKIIAPCIKAEKGLLDDLKNDIVAHFGKDAVSLVLYGSLARGEEKKGSDIDVIAVVRGKNEKTEVEENAASKAPYFNERYGGLLSLQCFTLDEIKRRKALPLFKSIKKEGVLLSGKPLGGISG
ncbi:MAG: nucleotidyltransferase domain-containing protein [Deltaproteobacteria bacterium]|nr:nucleotidyltransferase domain-containing protein [Deltaproteobacteria bacterium]